MVSLRRRLRPLVPRAPPRATVARGDGVDRAGAGLRRRGAVVPRERALRRARRRLARPSAARLLRDRLGFRMAAAPRASAGQPGEDDPRATGDGVASDAHAVRTEL